MRIKFLSALVVILAVLTRSGLAAEWTRPFSGTDFAKLEASETSLNNSGFSVRAQFHVPFTRVVFYTNDVLDTGFLPGENSQWGKDIKTTAVGTLVFTGHSEDATGNVLETLTALTVNVVSPRPPVEISLLPFAGDRGGFHVGGVIVRRGSPAASYVVEYGTTTAYGFELRGAISGPPRTRIGTIGAPIGDEIYFSTDLSGLPAGTTFHYRVRMDTAVGPYYSEDAEISTLPNLPPYSASFVYPISGANASVDIYKGSDIDGDLLTITSTIQPQWGTLDLVSSTNTYTAGPDFPGSDKYTITVSDSHAETISTIGVATREWCVAACDGSFHTFAFSDSEPSVPIGAVNFTVSRSGAFTGRLDYYGVPYSFKGNFEADRNIYGPWPEARVVIPRYGNPPFIMELAMSPAMVDGEIAVHFYGFFSSNDRGEGQFESGNPAIPTPDGNSAQFNASISAESGQSPAERPQGSGFALMKIAKKGSTQIVGRTGDNQPFTSGGRHTKGGQVRFFSKVSGKRTERVFGEFATGTGTNQISWYKPERARGPYSTGFISSHAAAVSRFHPYGSAETIFDTQIEVSPELSFKAFDHSGMLVTSKNLPSGEKFDSGRGTSERLKLKIERKTGLFFGKVGPGQMNPKDTKVMGVILPDQRIGHGVWRKPGFDARIELVPAAN